MKDRAFEKKLAAYLCGLKGQDKNLANIFQNVIEFRKLRKEFESVDLHC